MPPSRSPAAQVLAVLGSFAAGPLIGIGLTAAFAPESIVADVVGTFALPFAWIAGMVAWFGLGLGHALVGMLARIMRRERHTKLPERPAEIPRGFGAFVPISAAAGALAGAVSGLVAEASFVATLATWIAIAAAYGLALRWLAARAYLPFPEPE